MLSTLPNLLTLFRVLLVPVLVGCFFLPQPAAAWLAFAVFTIAGITDYFDGYFARSRNQTSAFGRFLDPIADKLLVAAALMMMVAADQITGLTVIAGIIILAREIIVSGLREFLAGDSVVVPVTVLAKWKTAVQMGAIGLLLMAPAVHEGVGLAGVVMLWIAAGLTVVTGIGYLRAGLGHIAEEDDTENAAGAGETS